jgi:hypothetical protein
MKTIQRNHSVAPIYILKSYKKGQINHTGPTPRNKDLFRGWYLPSVAKEIPVFMQPRCSWKCTQNSYIDPQNERFQSHSHLTHYFSEIHFRIIFPSTPSPPNSLFHSDFPTNISLARFLPCHLLLHVPPSSILLQCRALAKTGEDYKLQSSSYFLF